MISCIGRPVVDTESLVKSIEAATKKALPPGLSLLAVLALMQNRAANPRTVLRSCGSLLAHAHYVFQVAIPYETMQDLLERNDFKITICAEVAGDLQLAVISGTLKQFKEIAIECCQPHQPAGLRELCSDLVRFFMNEGLADIFYDLNKKPADDGTLILTRK